MSDPPSSSSPSVPPDSSEPPYSADAPSSDAPDREDQGPGAAQGPGRASADVEGAGDALPGDAVLRPMGWLDVPAVAAAEKALFGAEAWSPALLRTELAAASGPAADRYYLVAERMPRMSGRGSAGAGADSALDGVNAPGGELLGYAGLWFGDGAGDADLLTIATLPACAPPRLRPDRQAASLLPRACGGCARHARRDWRALRSRAGGSCRARRPCGTRGGGGGGRRSPGQPDEASRPRGLISD